METQKGFIPFRDTLGESIKMPHSFSLRIKNINYP